MKVLIVFNHPAPYKVRIFNELAKYVDLTVIFERTKAKDRPQDFYSCNDYKFKTIFLKDCYIGNEGTYSCGVKKYLKLHANEFDHIIMNGYSHIAEIRAIKYLNKKHIPFTLLINGGIIPEKENCFKKKYKTKLISSASSYMSPSMESNKYLIHYSANQKTIFNYPYSNFSKDEIANITVDKLGIREKYHLPKDKKIFVNASQFIDRKNNLSLIKIFEKRSDILLLIGSGKEEQMYKNYIIEHNIKNVIIMPFQKKSVLFEIFNGCDVFITLAHKDIFGHTTLEALANGLPVISSNKVNSSLEYIKDGQNGFIVNLDDLSSIDGILNKALLLRREDAIESAKNNTFEACGKAIFEILKNE